MTGIERLRELVGSISPIIALCGVTKSSYDRSHIEMAGARLRDFLADIADQIEREQNEDAKAIAWVREHGGLERVKAQRFESMPRAAYERKKAGFLGHIAECETALGRRREIISELNHRASDLTRENAELRKRAMPEGYEWPRYESGDLVQIGDDVVDRFSDDSIKVRSIELRDGVAYLREGFRTEGVVIVRPGERVKRSAKVLDADGVEIRVGDRVWSTHLDEPHEWIVIDPHEDRDDSQTVLVSIGDRTGRARPEDLTHRAPVLASDGKPLRVGETVYEIETGERYFVTNVFDGMTDPDFPEHTVECRKYEDVVTHMFRPSQLTHQRPDSFEQLEKDANDLIYDIGCYLGDYSPSHFTEEGDSVQDRVRDLVRRAKALAGDA